MAWIKLEPLSPVRAYYKDGIKVRVTVSEAGAKIKLVQVVTGLPDYVMLTDTLNGTSGEYLITPAGPGIFKYKAAWDRRLMPDVDSNIITFIAESESGEVPTSGFIKQVVEPVTKPVGISLGFILFLLFVYFFIKRR